MTRKSAISLMFFLPALLFAAPVFSDTGAPAMKMLDNFESSKLSTSWFFLDGPEYPGAKGSIQRTDRVTDSGKGALAVNFDFNGGGNYVMGGINLPRNNGAKGFRFRMKKSTANKITIRCTDAEQQTFQKTFNYTNAGWQEIEVSLDGWVFGWGGKKDGVFRGSPSMLGIIIENDAERTGTVYIDNLRMLTEPTDPMSDKPVNSTVTVFGSEDRWRLTGGGDVGASEYQSGGHLKTDFSKSAEAIGAATDIVILGKPQEMALSLDAEGDGEAEVLVRIGSHFQVFEQVIGALKASEGPQTFKTSMVGMKGWAFWGGENDGLPMYPLRLIDVLIKRPSAGSITAVSLKSVTVNTILSPDQRMVIVPKELRWGDKTHGVDIRSQLTSDAEASLNWEFVDYNGVTLHKGAEKVALKAGSRTAWSGEILAGLPEYAEVQYRLIVAGDLAATGVTSLIKPVAAKPDAPLDPKSMFGMGLYLYRYPNTPDGISLMKKAAALGRDAGVKWTREEFQWHRIEPQKGNYDFSYYDELVKAANDNGMSVYALIAYWSNWTSQYTKEGIADYSRYCEALVNRYKDRIKHWEIWNEPNIFFWSGPKELYSELLKEAYAAIKRADPEAYVLGCSTAGIDRVFIEQVKASGAPFDILTIHPYRGQLDEEGFAAELRSAAELAGEGKGKEKPVWITEMGWPTSIGDSGISERNQATLLARCYLTAVTSGIETNISWYNFREDGNNPFYKEHRFGVVSNDLERLKPGYRALATVCNTLGGLKLVRRVNLGEGIFAFEFGGNRQVFAIWSPRSSRPVSMRVSEAVEVVNLMGVPEPHLYSQENTSLILALQADSPVFVVSQKGVRLEQSTDISVDVSIPETIIAGMPFELSVKSTGLKINSAGIKPPPGFDVKQSANASWQITVPQSDRPIEDDIHLVIETTGGSLILPVRINATPTIVRI